MWEHAKSRLISLALGGMLALLGLSALTSALVIALAPSLGWIGAGLLVGGGFLLIAGGLIVFGLAPQKTLVEDAVDETLNATDEFMHLPVELIREAIESRPASMVALALALGYGVGARPQEAAQLATTVRAWLNSD